MHSASTGGKRVAGVSISAVERDTGLSKETLRTWERRYGFPKPARSATGERLYPAEQVEKLKFMRRLMDGGMRPGDIAGIDLEQLQAMARGDARDSHLPATHDDRLDALLRTIRDHAGATLRMQLHSMLMRSGLERFLSDTVAPLNRVVGEGWETGELSIGDEHYYSSQIQIILSTIINSLSFSPRGPRVLLTTLPGERHRIGLLMVEAVLSAELAECIALGAETPVHEIATAAVSGKIDVVALSFSSNYPSRPAISALKDLRASLPDEISIWAGGDGVKRVRTRLTGVVMPMTLASIGPELKKLNQTT